MNERIRELAEQAEEYAARNSTGDWEVGPAYQDLFNKKFAELVRADERDEFASDWEAFHGYDKHGVAAAIRARGTT